MVVSLQQENLFIFGWNSASTVMDIYVLIMLNESKSSFANGIIASS